MRRKCEMKSTRNYCVYYVRCYPIFPFTATEYRQISVEHAFYLNADIR